ncbi:MULTISPECIES: hypothetical protein [unclassified Brevundimonas]|uniref:hypothetical protein n=1 Tax=unclassified Brevundimonas TaxID=2622653 RepID=UPI003F9382F2
MSLKVMGIALAGLTMSTMVGAAAPMPMVQQYVPGEGIYCMGRDGCYPIAYQRDVYSDAALTNLIASASDGCTQSGDWVWITTPQLPTGYEVKTPMWVCSPMGPYLPHDW